jgi:hypothetical protein
MREALDGALLYKCLGKSPTALQLLKFAVKVLLGARSIQIARSEPISMISWSVTPLLLPELELPLLAECAISVRLFVK